MNTLLALLAMAGGLFVGYMDTHWVSANVQTVAALAALTFVLGCAGPRLAWLWAMLAGTGVPLLNLVLPPLGLAPENPGLPRTLPSYLLLTLVVMAVCFAGCYAGALVVRVARGLRAPHRL